MRRSERFGEIEFLLQQVNRDNLSSTSERSALNDVQADTTATNDSNGRSRLDLRGVDCRTDARHRSAANETGPIQWHVVTNLDRAALWYHRFFRKGCGVREMKNISPALTEARSAIEQGAERFWPRFTQVRRPLRAREAMATDWRERQYDVVTLFH